MLGWFRGFGRSDQRKSGTVVDITRALFEGGEAKSGARVNASTSLQVSTVLACVRVIAEGIAQVPFKLYRKDGDGRVEATNDPRFDLLHSRPSDLQTSFEFRETIALHAALTGDAFVYKVRSGERILELIPLDPGATTVIAGAKIGERPRYRYRAGATIVDFAADDVWHIKGPSWNGVRGLPIVALAREAIGLAMATEEHGARLFSNGARPSGILTSATDIPPDKQVALAKQWLEAYGSGNSGKTAVLAGGLEWKSVAMDSDSAQFLETRRFQIEEVCRAFRVMPIMVGYSDKAATYASAEQMFLAHVIHTLAPWYTRIEQSADAALLTDRDRASGLYSKFVAQGLMRADSRSFAEYASRMVQTGVITRNEVRALMEMNPLAGLSEPLRPVNMTTSLDDPPNPQNEGQGNAP